MSLEEVISNLIPPHGPDTQSRAGIFNAEVIRRLRAMSEGLKRLKSYAECNCPEDDDDDGGVRYHSNCHRKAMPIIEEALK